METGIVSRRPCGSLFEWLSEAAVALERRGVGGRGDVCVCEREINCKQSTTKAQKQNTNTVCRYMGNKYYYYWLPICLQKRRKIAWIMFDVVAMSEWVSERI